MSDGLSDEQRERTARIAGRCPVHRALVAGLEFDQRIVVEPARGKLGERAA